MYRIIACDLDETLLNCEKKVSAENIEAIAKAVEKGVKFVLATGRGYRTVQGTLQEIGLLEAKGEYVISFNGGAITENKGNNLMFFKAMDFAKADALYKKGISYGCCIHVYTKDTVYAWNLNESEKRFLNNRMPIVETDSTDLSFLSGQEIVKVLYMNEDRAFLNRIESEMKEMTQDLDVSYSSNRYIEFNKKGVNKGAGLKKLASLLNIPMEDTIAIGDNYNDLSMIKAAGLGIGVQNTVEAMKKECDYITSATHDQSAIAEVIEKFIL